MQKMTKAQQIRSVRNALAVCGASVIVGLALLAVVIGGVEARIDPVGAPAAAVLVGNMVYAMWSALAWTLSFGTFKVAGMTAWFVGLQGLRLVNACAVAKLDRMRKAPEITSWSQRIAVVARRLQIASMVYGAIILALTLYGFACGGNDTDFLLSAGAGSFGHTFEIAALAVTALVMVWDFIDNRVQQMMHA